MFSSENEPQSGIRVSGGLLLVTITFRFGLIHWLIKIKASKLDVLRFKDCHSPCGRLERFDLAAYSAICKIMPSVWITVSIILCLTRSCSRSVCFMSLDLISQLVSF